MTARVFALGLDAAEWTFLKRWIDDGTMPWLASFVEGSTFAETDNVECYRSEYIWTQLVTAQPSEVTGYWGIEHFDPATYASVAKGPYWGRPWYAETGLPTIIFDCPQLAVLPDIEGIQVAGWGAHGAHHPRASSPTGLIDELDATYGPHPALGQDFDPAWFVPAYIDALADWCIVGARARVSIMRDLMDRRPDWRLFLTCMSEFHIVGHNFWHGIDEVHPLHDHEHAAHCRRRFNEVMAVVDAEVGGLVESLGADTDVVVFALHGMWGADDAVSMALVPELVTRLETGERHLRVDGDRDAWDAAGRPPVIPSSHKQWAANTWMRDRFAVSGGARLKSVVRRVLPERQLDRLKTLAGRPGSMESGTPCPVPGETRLSPAEIRSHNLAHESVAWQPACWYRDAFASMRYFALPTFTDIHLRINLIGREAEGIVDPADYEAVCDEAIAQMQRIIDPRSGACPVRSVHRVRAADPFAEPGPDADIIAVVDCPTDAIWHPDAGMLGPVPFQRTGAHSPRGWVAARGPSFEPHAMTERRAAADIARTLIDLLGVDPPTGAEGESFANSPRPAQERQG